MIDVEILMDYKVVLCASMAAYMYNPSTPGAEAGEWRVWSENWQLMKSCSKEPNAPYHTPQTPEQTALQLAHHLFELSLGSRSKL